MELKAYKTDGGYWRYDSDSADFLLGTHRIEIVIDVSNHLHQVTMVAHQYARNGNTALLDENGERISERWAYPVESLEIKTKNTVKGEVESPDLPIVE